MARAPVLEHPLYEEMRVVRFLLVLAAAGPVWPAPESVPGKHVVKMRAGAVLSGTFASRATRIATRIPGTRRDPDSFAALGLDRVWVVTGDATRLAAEPGVERIEPLYVYRLAATVPDDPRFADQWGHENTGQSGGTPDADMDSTRAWDFTTGTPAAIVAVLDTGVQIDHPDLVGNLLPGVDFTGSPWGIDDVVGHGTQVTGNAAAVGDNATGVAGMCWGCRALPLKIYDLGTSLTLEQIVPAIVYAADAGADAINMSFGGEGWSATFMEAVDYAAGLGALSVASSGNAGTYEAFVPAAFPNVVSVAGTNELDERYGSYGDHAELAAPTGVVTTWPGGIYFPFGGTSASAPFVAGVVGLLRSANPTLHVQEIRQILRRTAEDDVGPAGEDPPGWDGYFGYGRVNAGAALALSDGRFVAFDRPHYACGGTAAIDVRNPGATPPTAVHVTTSGGDAESVAVVAVHAFGYFRGEVALGGGPPVPGDGVVQLAHGETLTASVGPLTGSAVADCEKAVCLAPIDALPLAGDCDADGILDPAETWTFEAGPENMRTDPLSGVILAFSPSDPSVATSGPAAYGTVDPVSPPPALPFEVSLAAPGPPGAVVALDAVLSGTGFVSDEAACASAGAPPGVTVTTNADGGGPEAWLGTPPSRLVAEIEACPSELALSWDPVPGAAEYAVSRGERACQTADQIGTVVTAAFADEGVAPGVTYHYGVEAREAGTACVTNRACVSVACPCVAPSDPVDLVVGREGPAVLLAWNDPDEVGTEWKIYRSASVAPEGWSDALFGPIGDQDPSTPGIQVADGAAAASSASYFYLITGINACGESPLFPR